MRQQTGRKYLEMRKDEIISQIRYQTNFENTKQFFLFCVTFANKNMTCERLLTDKFAFQGDEGGPKSKVKSNSSNDDKQLLAMRLFEMTTKKENKTMQRDGKMLLRQKRTLRKSQVRLKSEQEWENEEEGGRREGGQKDGPT